MDGQLLTNIPAVSAPAYPFAWQTDPITGLFLQPANDVASLKHLRLYDREATTAEVQANFRNKCLLPAGALAVQGTPLLHWGRFNIPAAGGESTSGPGSTIEKAMRFLIPDHRLPTNYVYNSLNQVEKQSTPDGGVSQFWYDRLGRLAVSQNAEQLSPAVVNTQNPANRYSYTRYDALGRILETGEKLGAGAMTEQLARTPSLLETWLGSGNNRQISFTAYDKAPVWAPVSLSGTLFNLRKRVAATALLASSSTPGATNPSVNRQAASYYSYDMAGNVSRLVQENKALSDQEGLYIANHTGFKEIKYDYDLVSGKVNKVSYQDGKWDQFYYRYLYDADNRLTDAYTSRYDYPVDAVLSNWTLEAHYRYYPHGPLARVELGKNKVQGVDYAYTLQGWLKGVNSNFLELDKDMNGDSKPGGVFEDYGRDVFGFSLGYYSNDYTPIGGVTAPAFGLGYQEPAVNPNGIPRNYETGRGLYNGNISHAVYTISALESGATVGYTYKYDQLNRLLGVNRHNGITPSTTTWDNSGITQAYKESVSYDASGNIRSFLRNGPAGQLSMDDLTYGYSLDGSGHLINNRLRHVKDAVTSHTTDIGNQPDDNYNYDRIGNLTKDQSEEIAAISWTVYGKIASITKDDGVETQYGYDAGGNRIRKTVVTPWGDVSNTYYVRDAQGNVLGVYAESSISGNFAWSEQHLYGSNRLGIARPGLEIPTGQPLSSDAYTAVNDPLANGIEGKRFFELTNHLGNVLTTISDRKTPHLNGSAIDYYEAEVVSAQDYYPGGMIMPGRNLNPTLYPYSINGQETAIKALSGNGSVKVRERIKPKESCN